MKHPRGAYAALQSLVGRSLFADDGALWVRGQNIKYQQKLQGSTGKRAAGFIL